MPRAANEGRRGLSVPFLEPFARLLGLSWLPRAVREGTGCSGCMQITWRALGGAVRSASGRCVNPGCPARAEACSLDLDKAEAEAEAVAEAGLAALRQMLTCACSDTVEAAGYMGQVLWIESRVSQSMQVDGVALSVLEAVGVAHSSPTSCQSPGCHPCPRQPLCSSTTRLRAPSPPRCCCGAPSRFRCPYRRDPWRATGRLDPGQAAYIGPLRID